MPSTVQGNLPVRLTVEALNVYIQKLTEPIYRNARLLGALKAKGRIKVGVDSPDIRWKARVLRREPQVLTPDMANVTFNSGPRTVEAVLPWRGYTMGEHVNLMEKLVGRKNKAAVLPRILDNVIKWSMDDMQVFLQKALYYDGDSGTNHIHGLESWFGYGANIGGTPVRTPNDTYAGLTTALGGLAYGGSWTGAWPTGDGEPQYCAWSPLCVDYKSTLFGGNTWDANWSFAIRYATTYLSKLTGEIPDIAVMDPDLLRRAKDSLQDKYRLSVTPKSPIVDMGIQTMNFDGIELMDDPFCPTGKAYVLNSNRLELLSLQDQLLAVNTKDDVLQSDYTAVMFIGNLRCESPAYHAVLFGA